jgi:hypoxanthine phosphoribosyltransferase
VQLLYDPEVSLRGRHVILVDDIIDSGKTMAALVPLIRARGPGSLEMCTFLHKRRNGIAHQPRWVGFDAPREFVVGYGLDYSENFRHLPYIASI